LLHVIPLLLSIKALKAPQKRKRGGELERASRKEERAGWEMWSKVRTSCRTSQGKGCQTKGRTTLGKDQLVRQPQNQPQRHEYRDSYREAIWLVLFHFNHFKRCVAN